MSSIVSGTIRNGERVGGSFEFYTGMFGVRDRADGKVELGIVCDRLPNAVGCAGNVGGVALRVLEARKSETVPDIVVLVAERVRF